MEENNNNLGDFFRKRLSSMEGEDQDWFNPEPRTDAQILEELAMRSKKQRNNKRWLLLLPFLLFLGMFAYVFHLKQQIADLSIAKEALIAQNTYTSSIANTQKQPKTISSEKAIAELNKASNENRFVENSGAKRQDQTSLTKALKIENQKLQQLIAQKEARIQALQFELSQKCTTDQIYANFADQNNSPEFDNLLSSKINTKSTSTNQLGKEFSSVGMFLTNGGHDFLSTVVSTDLETPKTFKDLAVLKPALLTNPLEMESVDPDYSFSLKKKAKRRLNSFEIGFGVGLQVLLTNKKINLLNQRIIGGDSRIGEGELVEPCLGINIAYSPFKNFWIRLGAYGGGSSKQSGQEIGIIYNDLGEYSLPSGDIGIDFVLNSSTGYTKAINTLQVTVPNGTTNGDLFELGYYEELKTTHIQVPISVEYFFGSKKWQPFIHAGAKWNLFHYEWKWNAPYTTINSRGQEVDFDFKNAQENVKTFQYMSFVTGAGLNWNFRPQFSLRTTLGMEYNVLLDDVNKIANSDFSRNGFFVTNGLYYKF